jgi:hypothetical protein
MDVRTMTDEIRGLADLRPGDVMFGPIGGLVPGVFPVAAGQLLLGEAFRIGRLSIRHAGIVIAAMDDTGAGPLIVEAMPRGARVRRLTVAGDWTDRHAYLRQAEDYPGQAVKAAGTAEAMVGTPYSFASYAALAAWRFGWRTDRLAAYINRRGGPLNLPAELICSQLVDEAWTAAGKQVMPHGTRPQIVTPGALAARLWNAPGTVRGGVGIL